MRKVVVFFKIQGRFCLGDFGVMMKKAVLWGVVVCLGVDLNTHWER